MTAKGVAPAIGIDLGTRYSCVGVWHQDKVDIIVNDVGNRTTPSIVAFTPAECLIGESAQNQVTRNPENTIYDAQRLVGRRFSDPEVQEGITSWPFKVIKGAYGLPKVVVEYKGKERKYSAEEISSMVLVSLKDQAESYLGTTVKDAVITVPAYFSDSQRQATKVAAHIAGLDVLQIIDEPVAAAIAYQPDNKCKETNLLIFDLDDDACAVSLVTSHEKEELTVKATRGDSPFRGQDIVNIMVDHFIKEFERKHKMDLSRNLRALERLRYYSEKAIQDLSSHTKATIDVDGLFQGIDFYTTITRKKFEYISRSFFSNCIETVESFLSDEKINKADVDDIVLVGGLTSIPKIHQLLREFFNGKQLLNDIHAKEVVAYGATVLATKLSREKNEKAKNLPLLDTVPLSLGVEAHDGVFSVIIPRNTPIPAEKESIYFTTRDNQRSMSFNIYQGERSRAKDNIVLGKFEVELAPAAKGKSKVKVVFSVDADGIFTCWVKEFTTGLKKKIIIDYDKMNLSNEEIKKTVKDAKKFMKDAEKYTLEDQEYKKVMCARNVLEEYIYNVRRKMKTIGSTDKTRLHAEEIRKMDNAIEVASQYINGNPELADVDEYQKVLKELEKLCVDVITQLV